MSNFLGSLHITSALLIALFAGCSSECADGYHDFTRTDCMKSEVCRNCGCEGNIPGHSWENGDNFTPTMCSECGIEIVLPEITEGMRLSMPNLRPEIKQAMGEILTPEQEIDTFMASMRLSYERYLEDGDMQVFVRTTLLLFEEYGYLLDEVTAVDRSMYPATEDGSEEWYTDRFNEIVLSTQINMWLVSYDHNKLSVHVENPDNITWWENETCCLINTCAEHFYGRGIVGVHEPNETISPP